jgi:hypothetical protein
MTELHEDLAFVRAVVEDSRRAVQVDAWPLLAWGLLTVAGVILVYLWPSLDSVWLWLVVIGLAWVLTGVRVAGSGSEKPARLATRALSSLWFGLLTAMTLIGFVGSFSGALPTATITPIVAAIFGAGYLASSALLDWRALSVLAAVWWAGAVVLLLIADPYRLALFGGLVLVLLVLPVSRFLLVQNVR